LQHEQPDEDGAATCKPSTALSTEIDGVMTPSPKSSAAPTSTSAVIHDVPRWRSRRRSGMSANSAKIPPSPFLSARRTKVRYLIATTTTSDQKISERMPRIAPGVGATPRPGVRHSCKV
jgi:hypothetical protein